MDQVTTPSSALPGASLGGPFVLDRGSGPITNRNAVVLQSEGSRSAPWKGTGP